MRTSLALSLAATLALTAGCGGRSGVASSGPSATPAALTVTIQPGFVAHRKPHTYRLTCAPVGGTLPDPAAACLALARHPSLLRPVSRCRRVLPDIGRVQVRGMVGGRPVSMVFACPETLLRWRVLATALRVPAAGMGPMAR
jgi:Subtilisin inhibitor-like